MRIREMVMATIWTVSAASGAEVARAVVTVRVFDKAGVPAQTLREAGAEAQRIFRKAGIETRWLLCSPSQEADGQDAACSRGMIPGELSVGMIPRSMEGDFRVPAASFGLAIFGADGRPASYAYVLYGRVEAALSKITCPGSALLGHVIAHEVGHLLLGQAHSPSGLMGAKWDCKTLTTVARGLLVFSGDDAQRLQAAAGQLLLAAQ